jgi:hypothetical protein
MAQGSSHTTLVMNRKEARKRLRERVDQAVDLYPGRIDSQDDLAIFRRKKRVFERRRQDLGDRQHPTKAAGL